MPAAVEKSPSVTIVDTPPPKPPPAPTSSINVSQMGTSATPAAPTKRGSAMQRMTEALRNKAAPAEAVPNQPKTASATKTPAVPTPELPPEGDETASSSPSPSSEAEAETSETTTPAVTEAESETAQAKPTTGKPAEKGKVSPWKLVDQYKAQTVQLQKEIAELRASITPEVERKTLMERVEQAEKTAKELSDEIRYVNYEKSPEFKEQFHAPYEAEFRRALEDLSEVSMVDENGVAHKLSGDHLAQLAFMDFQQAKETANRLFPDFANDIMAARKDIRAAWEKRQSALKEWRDKGAQREQQRTELSQKQAAEMQSFTKQAWEKAIQQVTGDERHGHLFKPVEGDEEWNKRLSKGFELVDKALAENVFDPRLTPEARAQAVKRMVAMRARAAGWGALRLRTEQLNSKVAALEKELAQYKSTTPKASGTESAATEASEPPSAMGRLTQSLRKIAH